jgi:type II secretion system protein I
MPRASQPAGFTLIEVLVALAVLATVLYVSAGGLGTSARTQAAREERLLAHWAALDAATGIVLEAGPETFAGEPPPTRGVEMLGRQFEVRFTLREGEPIDPSLGQDAETKPPRWLVVEARHAATPTEVLQALEVPLP